MIGVGILTTSGYILKDTGSGTVLLGLWLAGGLIAMCGALVVAELATAMPHAGGEYVFIREAYGRPWAFLYGWVSLVIGFSGPTAIIAHGAGRYLVEPWFAPDDPNKLLLARAIAVLLVLGFTAVHVRGHAFSSGVQSISTLFKLAVLVGLVVAVFACRHSPEPAPAAATAEDPVPWGVLAISLVYVMYSYSGWNAATYLAGEVREPARTLPWATLWGCGGVVALYVLLNVVYVIALPVAQLRALSYEQVEPIAVLAVRRLFGPWVSGPFALSIGLGLLSSISAYLLTGPRIHYAMARDGIFPAFAGRVNGRGVPVAATLAQAGLTVVLLLSGTLRNILTYAGVGLSVSAFFVVLAVFVLRVRRPDLPRPFRTPFYPITPLVFLVCTGWMIIFAFRQQPIWSAVSLLAISAGIPMYYIWHGRRRG
jgi:APA family basic amino acid/polyamine antiporter